jgi:hypothetical protein
MDLLKCRLLYGVSFRHASALAHIRQFHNESTCELVDLLFPSCISVHASGLDIRFAQRNGSPLDRSGNNFTVAVTRLQAHASREKRSLIGYRLSLSMTRLFAPRRTSNETAVGLHAPTVKPSCMTWRETPSEAQLPRRMAG